jgi:hypothetical protein
MYDDEEDIEDEEYEIGLEQAAEAYDTKGKEDRAFVDQQAKEYDEVKKKKRDEITHLKNIRLTAQSKLAHKERELAALLLTIRKDQYLETRERVQDEREEAMHDEKFTREEKADLEVEGINREMDREDREAKHEELRKECAELKAHVDEISRQISLLEYELIRS